ncbi:MAG: hypothetical protein R2712_22180 [Vicinamibacterales bacterium]
MRDAAEGGHPVRDEDPDAEASTKELVSLLPDGAFKKPPVARAGGDGAGRARRAATSNAPLAAADRRFDGCTVTRLSP